MKTEAFKKIIKEAVKEVIQEELSLELRKIVREELSLSSTSSQPITESQISSNTPVADYKPMMQQLSSEMASTFMGGGNPTPVAQPFRPSPTNTAAEGSALPPGELSLDQIAGLLKK